MTEFTLRYGTDNDVASLVRLFTESVHGIAARSYSPEQIEAWAPRHPDLARWRTRLAPLTTLIAEDGDEPVGFIAFSDAGHIEFLFTAPAFSRQGVASKLYAVALEMLHAKGVEKLTTEASLASRPFFERKGFEVVEEQSVERGGIKLKRYLMRCCLEKSGAGQCRLG